MSAGPFHPARARLTTLSPATLSLLIALTVGLGLLALQQPGWLQFLEFKAYDFFLRQQPKASNSEPIVLIEMTEEDIHSATLDWPVPDEAMATLLQVLADEKPAAIGLDMWRDVPVPRSGSGLPRLNSVLQSNANIVVIFTLDGIAAPPILQNDPDRIAFNDNFPPDREVDGTTPKVRRSLIFGTRPDGQIYDSFPFRVASLYLAARGVQPKVDPADPNSLTLGKARLRRFRSSDGAYVRADDAGFQILLDFKCPDQFTRYTFSDVLARRVPPERLRDKIVLIGINTTSVFDERVTPMHPRHPGVRLQAQAVHQLLRAALTGEKPLQFWPDWLETAWLLGWCLVGGALGYAVRSPWRYALAAALCLAALAWISAQSFAAGWWIPVVTPALGFVPATALVVSYVSHQERTMRTVLMKLYSRHVSKEIAETTWANRDLFLQGHRPLAQKLVVTVLFTDLKGFSTISEKMEPDRLYLWLNRYLGNMATVVQEHGGVLKQFTGDGILVLFGVPMPRLTREEQALDAKRSVRCALAMGRRLVQLIDEWKSEDLPAVSMRAGIHTGEVAAGSIGSDDRFEYAVIGDVVNTASRLESYDKSFANPDQLPNRCRILVGASTHELLDDTFVTREIGLLEVKGKANKVPVFQVLATELAPAATTQISTGSSPNAAQTAHL